MDNIDWQRQLLALHEGTLRLEEPGESGLTAYASTTLYELRRYVKALECGYRKNYKELAGYRYREGKGTLARLMEAKERLERANAELLDRQWSEGACLGYAVMGLRGAGFSPADAVRVLEAMQEAMSLYTLRQAAEAHQAILEDRVEGTSSADVEDREEADGQWPPLRREEDGHA